MAQINLSDVLTGENTQQNQVGFFNLQNDGDEAVVRFMVDSLEDLEILTVHDIFVNGKFRQISCVRDPREPIEKCPLCSKGEKIKQAVFIKMIQYVNTPDGIEAKPVVWQRSASTYAFRIKGYLDNYGPLSNILCKIIRHGAKGDMKTTYDIIPNLSPVNYPQENYPILNDAFEDYSALGRVVLDKKADDINVFINTGSFPENNDNVSEYSNDNIDIRAQIQYNDKMNSQYNNEFNSEPTPFEKPVMGTMGRPTRYY